MTTGGNVEAAHPTMRGVIAAYISETTGGWATATVTTPSSSSRLARQPLSPYRERTEEKSNRTSGHENGERDRVTATGHSDHIGGQVKATAAAGSGQQPRPVTPERSRRG